MKISHMECWVSKYGKKGHWSSFLKKFLKNIKKWRFWFFEIYEKGQNLRPFSGLAPSKLKFFSKKFNGSICAYRVIYLLIFSGTEKSVVLRGFKYCSWCLPVTMYSLKWLFTASDCPVVATIFLKCHESVQLLLLVHFLNIFCWIFSPISRDMNSLKNQDFRLDRRAI